MINTPLSSSPVKTASKSGSRSNPSRAGKSQFGPKDTVLLTKHYPLVRSVVNSMRSHLPACADLDELHSVGVTGLVAAVRKYNAEQAKTFEGYAALRIRGAILDELRRMDWMPRTARSQAKHIKEATEKLEQTHGRAPTEDELRKEMGLNQHDFRRMQTKVSPIRFMSLDDTASTQDGEGKQLHESIADETTEPFTQTFERKELMEVLVEKIKELPEQKKRVLGMYYFEGMRLAEIASVFNVTEARICQIHTQALAVLKKNCQSLN